MNGRDLYRMALRVLIGAVGLSAVLGILALLQRDLDEWSFKTLGTTLFVSATSLLIILKALLSNLSRNTGSYWFRGSGRTYQAYLVTVDGLKGSLTLPIMGHPNL